MYSLVRLAPAHLLNLSHDVEIRFQPLSIASSVVALVLGHSLAFVSASALANGISLTDGPTMEESLETREPVDTESRSWSLRIDNDLFAGRQKDRDYTGGFNVTLLDEHTALAAPTRGSLHWLNQKTGFGKEFQSSSPVERADILELGVTVFTPDDIGQLEPIQTDRPYASLLFLSSSHHALNNEKTKLGQSTFTLGLLGSSVAETLHRRLHRLGGIEEPQGYTHQISDGGELTARYSVSSYSLLSGGSSYDLKWGLEGSIGYLTEGAFVLGARWGRISSPWWSSVSDHADYSSQPSLGILGPSADRDLYLSVGIKLHARAYNAFLQGQFRQSNVTFASSQLHPIVGEAWLGVIADVGTLRLSYTLRYESAQLKGGLGARGFAWGGLMVAKRLR